MNELDFYRQQSVFTHPGRFIELWDTVEPTIPAMKAAITPLLFHYRGDGDWAENGIDPERISEVNLRYASDLLACATAHKPITPGETREAKHRVVGCCRDWALLFVSLARHHGFAARSRVGFSGYFMEGWWIDHTIAEIWDESEQRWRLVDAELREPWNLADGTLVDPLDISRDIFLTGFDAWRDSRNGSRDAEKFVVHPDIDEANLRGVPYLWHNTILDLAALNNYEMILWDVWGMDEVTVNDGGAQLLDRVAASMTLAEYQQYFAMSEFRVPETITSFQQELGPVQVTLRHT